MSRRLLVSYLLLAALILGVLAVPLAITFNRSERRALFSQIERDAIVLAASAADTLERRPRARSLPDLERRARAGDFPPEERIVVVRTDGTAIFDTSNEVNADDESFLTPGRTEFVDTLTNGARAIGTRHSNQLGTDLLYVVVPVVSNNTILGALRITFPTKFVDARIRRVWLLLGSLALSVLAVAALLGLRFAKSIAGPLARLERASVAAGEGDLSVRAPITGPGEVRSLATRFNQMVSRLEDLVREREAFVADASHQLRTPLAAMRLRIENLEAGATADDRADLEAAVAEVDRLNRMVDGLLVLSRPASAVDRTAALDLETLIAERVELWAALGDEQGVPVTGEIVVNSSAPHRLLIAAAPGRIEQVIDNLIENALAATDAGSIVVRAGYLEGGSAEIHVIDSGRGMSAAERSRAFDRFWRSERNSSDGTGLGLTIVRRLVEADGGTISLHEAPTGGLDVQITYPLAQPDPTGAGQPISPQA